MLQAVAGGLTGVSPFGSRSGSGPSDFKWFEQQGLPVGVASPAVVSLSNGDVFVIGGSTANGPTTATEIFDHELGVWKPGPSMGVKRVGHTATLLNDGTVLVCGGETGAGVSATAERLNISKPGSLPIAGMFFARAGHSAVLLTDGSVLVAGGTDLTSTWKQAERYNPATNVWTPAGSMSSPRAFFQMSRLSAGAVLAAGGDAAGTSEKYDPSANSWSGVAQMNSARSKFGLAPLSNGRLLVAGGLSAGSPLKTAELYDPSRNVWGPVQNMSFARADFSLSTLQVGVLAAGSFSNLGTTNSTELFNPETSSWIPAKPMNHSRGSHGAAILGPTSLLVIGGRSGATISSSVELFAKAPIKVPEICQPKDIIPLVKKATELAGNSGNGLIAKLLAAQAKYEARDFSTCINIMNAFNGQLKAFIRSGHISGAHATELYDAYASVVRCLGGTPQSMAIAASASTSRR